MYKTLLRFSGAMLLTLLTSSAFSQIVTGNTFLQSNYIEMGINGNGVYISNVAPPAGYQPAPLGILGIIADSDKDGWGVGTPSYCGDYFAPGSPEEGWVVSANGVNYYNTYSGAAGVPNHFWPSGMSCITPDCAATVTRFPIFKCPASPTCPARVT